MDDSVLSLFSLIIIGAIIFFAVSRLSSRTPEEQGAIGENNIAHIILRAIRKGLYGYVLQNVYVPKSDGGTSEVDVILICTKGIFVFESKDFVGWIFGDDEHKFWTVSLYAGKNWLGAKQTEKHKFYNPIWQNNSHIRNLKKILGSNVPITSVVVFSNRCELKEVTNYTNTRIIQTNNLKYYLTSIRKTDEDILPTKTVDLIHNKLLPYTNADDVAKQSHIFYINEQKANPTICPRCGGKLVVRTAKRGANIGSQFYGCSNYPKCKYTRNIE